jgi:hypothetical protein
MIWRRRLFFCQKLKELFHNRLLPFNKCPECYRTKVEGEDNCLTLRPPPVDNKATTNQPGCIILYDGNTECPTSYWTQKCWYNFPIKIFSNMKLITNVPCFMLNCYNRCWKCPPWASRHACTEGAMENLLCDCSNITLNVISQVLQCSLPISIHTTFENAS